MSTLARWCHRHRLAVLLIWLAALVALMGASQVVGSAYNNDYSLPGTQSARATALLQQNFPAQAGDTDTVVWQRTGGTGTVRDPAVVARMDAVLDRIAHLPSVTGVTGPYDARGAAQISRDSRIAYAQIGFDRPAAQIPKADVLAVIRTAQAARQDGLRVELGGGAVQNAQQSPLSNAALVGVAAAAVVLFLAFGSLLTMVLPIVLGVAAVGAALATVALLSHAVAIGDFGPTLGALIGLGVGIDYALFIVTRHRSGLRSGLAPEQALVTAMNTSGRAVLFAGATVTVALLGMFSLGQSFLDGLAVAAAVTVVFTVLAAVTLLPALLSLLGRRVLGRRGRRTAAGPETNPGWARWARVVERRPRALALVAVVLMAALAIPLGSIRMGITDQGNDPTSSTTRQAYDLLSQGFGPGFNGPVQLVVDAPRPDDRAALDAVAAAARSTPGVASATALPLRPGSTVGVVQVVPGTAPQSAPTADLLHRLRTVTEPQAEAATGTRIYLGGYGATLDDFTRVISGKILWFVAVVVGLGFLLLTVAFRSLGVPALSAVMNLLAAGATFGILVAGFQWGHLSEPLGVGGAGPIEPFIPVVMFAILYGLSMDYQVFLVSRMHEEWIRTGDNRRAVNTGQRAAGRVVSAAAAIMICVFASFLLSGQRPVAEFGLGLAAAVALDAFVLRTVLVPAAMHLIGPANWWLPRRLDRILPRLALEAAEQAPEASAAERESVDVTTGGDRTGPVRSGPGS
ncbi:MMPL family transporter [Streptacidiphilus sp. N1-10]|uniref:MMPL family transporter n=1 Tax=Streptacidiphilus jeojiensis TaxID=3229225 RepID=A0ABV6XYR9_9ACTN